MQGYCYVLLFHYLYEGSVWKRKTMSLNSDSIGSPSEAHTVFLTFPLALISLQPSWA